ncbi:hypothetical protein THAOC_15281 [Thalassiosira oceanica]|uniref:Uncharacterized protein n=1 Tax=Thalassiosira oceanica TaxID=159749 RepID=K0T0K9_THAOC|nr:hypothetical protein THAOC_15281 [Thalassiosira oceanica]|eukprot:EJK64027.1 hypothetical protein THAOC_15281 [Thalassiosira oceanica]
MTRDFKIRNQSKLAVITSRDGQLRIDLPPQPDGRSRRSRAESPSPSPLPQNRGLGFPIRRCRHCAREGSSGRPRRVHDRMGRGKRAAKPAPQPAGIGGMSGADLSLLMPGDVSELPDDQLAEIMQKLTFEQQKRSQKQPCPPAGPAPARRSSRSRSPKPKTKSRGPPVDAMNENQVDVNVLWDEIDGGKSHNSYLKMIDFVDVPDDLLRKLFTTSRVKEKTRAKEGDSIPCPPLHRRRSIDHLRQWFNQFGPKQREDIASKGGDEYEVVKDHDGDLVWDGERWGQPHREDSEEGGQEMPPARTSLRRLHARDHRVLCHGNNNEIRYVVKERPHDEGQSQYDFMSVHPLGCGCGELAEDDQVCQVCQKSKSAIIRLVDNQLGLRDREGGVDPRTRTSLLRTSSLQREQVNYHRRESRRKGKIISRRDQALARLEEETGVDVLISTDNDLIFNEKNLEKARQVFVEKNDLSHNSIAEYAFEQSVAKHIRAKRSGAKSVRHCPLMIRLGAIICQKMGYSGGLYNLIAKIAGLPDARTVRRYTVTNSNDEDGIMHSNCNEARIRFNNEHDNEPRTSFQRHGVLAFDSMHTKGRFGISRNTNELIAVADDAFEEDVIMTELNALDKAASSDGDDADMEKKLPVMSKHFLVFIFTTWSADTKIQFLVARYALPTIKSPFLTREIGKVIMSLVQYGFIVNTVTGDGASENRACFKGLATLTARQVLAKNGHWSENELEGLPLDFKIGFEHPHPLLDVIVVIGGEMPHWVKKFRNAFDNKSRNLKFEGKDMELVMLYNIWLASGDADCRFASSLRKYIFTHDHFNLNAYLKMRVFLAIQIPSQTCIKMIKDHCDSDKNEDKLEDYEPMIKLFDKVDRLVDIWNGSNYKKSKVRDVELINKPKHRHIQELFDVLRVFEEWKEEGGGKFTKNFITKQTYEDLVWMVFGVAAVASLYLKDDGSLVMHQGRGGSDVCEHFFAKLRYINPNPTMDQAREGASRITSTAGAYQHVFVQVKKGNSGTAVGDISTTAAQVMAPMESKKSSKRPKLESPVK